LIEEKGGTTVTVVECASCGGKVDLDNKSVKQEEYGTDLKVVCSNCGSQFVVARIAQVRQQLKVAQYGWKRDAKGREVRIRLDQ
jgi:predicted RNA-binding Zn-ribbon protein involved in translation (DUF1610 family)